MGPDRAAKAKVQVSLRRWAEDGRTVARQLWEEKRDDLRMWVMSKLMERAAWWLERGAAWFDEPTEVVALATRNVFELNMIARWTCERHENAAEWLAETLKDSSDLVQDVMFIEERWGNKDALARLDQLSGELRNASGKWRTQHRIETARRPSGRRLARAVGLETEYVDLYRWSSKWLHPSAMVINMEQDAMYQEETKATCLTMILAMGAEVIDAGRELLEDSAALGDPC